MSSFDVVTDALTGASSQIGGAAMGAGDARASTSSASSQAGAFEGEPIGATFSEVCARAKHNGGARADTAIACALRAGGGRGLPDHRPRNRAGQLSRWSGRDACDAVEPAGRRETMTVPFPQLPKGSPGGIDSAARSLRAAGSELESSGARLASATGSLSGSWQGPAAQAYRGSADTLGWCARGAADSFRTCASAVSGYSSALDRAQSAMRRLRVQYDDATARVASANATAGNLAGSLVNASKSATPGLQTQLAAAQRTATSATGEADSYATAAQKVLDEFKAEASRYQAQLGGNQGGPLANPLLGGPLGAPATPFGIPIAMPGGMAAYNGVLPVLAGGPMGPGLVLASHAADLPQGGAYPYNSGLPGNRPNKPPNGQGYKDKYGNRWEWERAKNEWNVQHPGRSRTHTNVGPDGEITHGKDNFPSVPKPPKVPAAPPAPSAPSAPPSSDGGGGGGGPNAVEIVAGGLLVGGAIFLAPETGGGSLLALVGL